MVKSPSMKDASRNRLLYAKASKQVGIFQYLRFIHRIRMKKPKYREQAGTTRTSRWGDLQILTWQNMLYPQTAVRIQDPFRPPAIIRVEFDQMEDLLDKPEKVLRLM